MHALPACMLPKSRAPVPQRIPPTTNRGPYFPACTCCCKPQHLSPGTFSSLHISALIPQNRLPLQPKPLLSSLHAPKHITALRPQHRHPIPNQSSRPEVLTSHCKPQPLSRKTSHCKPQLRPPHTYVPMQAAAPFPETHIQPLTTAPKSQDGHPTTNDGPNSPAQTRRPAPHGPMPSAHAPPQTTAPASWHTSTNHSPCSLARPAAPHRPALLRPPPPPHPTAPAHPGAPRTAAPSPRRPARRGSARPQGCCSRLFPPRPGRGTSPRQPRVQPAGGQSPPARAPASRRPSARRRTCVARSRSRARSRTRTRTRTLRGSPGASPGGSARRPLPRAGLTPPPRASGSAPLRAPPPRPRRRPRRRPCPGGRSLPAGRRAAGPEPP